MLPEIGATELLVIAAIALIVVGPKDLPVMLRKLGQFVGRMRSMAAEFRSSFDEMARQSELDELRKEVQAMRAGRYLDPVRQAAEDARDVEVERVFDDIGRDLRGEAAYEPPPVLEAPKPKKPRAPRKKAEVEAVAAPTPKKPRAPRKTAEVAPAPAPKKPRRKKPEASA